jgi:hypothetical protein
MSMQSLLRKLRRLETLVGAQAIVPQPARTFRDFAATFLQASDGNRSVALRPVSALHQLLAERLPQVTQQRGRHINVLAPRGSAKSMWASFAYPLWGLAERSEAYIVLIADSTTQADMYLTNVRGELEDNDALRKAYPHLQPGRVWRNNAIQVAGGALVESLGTGQKIRGRRIGHTRPTLIIVDDPQSTEQCVSPLLRHRSWQWLTKDVMNAGSPQTNVVVLGTAIHRECIVCQLRLTPGWETHLFRSIMEWPKRMDLWSMWEGILHDWADANREERARLFYEANRESMDA